MSSKIVLAVLLLFAAVGCASAQRQNEAIELLDGQIKLVLPKGFEPVSKKTVDYKFAVKTPEYEPEVALSERIFAYADKKHSFAIAVSFFSTDEFGSAENAVVADIIPDIKKLLEDRLQRNVSDLEWRKRELVESKGTKWIHLSFKTNEKGIPSIYDLYMTDFQGYLLAVSISAPVSEYERNKDMVSKIIASISTNPDTLGVPDGIKGSN